MQFYSNLTFVYWIHKPTETDMYTQGYVGVTTNTKRRWRQHQTEAFRERHANFHLSNAINKYGDTLIYAIVFLGNEQICYSKEQQLRPTPAIGWNIMSGGPVGKITEEGRKRITESLKGPRSEAQKINRRWHAYQNKHKNMITKTEFLELESINKKQVPPSKQTASVIELSTCTTYETIYAASIMTGISEFSIYLEATNSDGEWMFLDSY